MPLKRMSILFSLLVSAISSLQAQSGFTLINKPEQKKIEVRYDGKLLTAYCYFDSTEKPVLFPLKTLRGTTITRGYPVAPEAGERTDHPHHLGLWMNYESVNGLDFWNNSNAIPAERKSHYGSIRHQKLLTAERTENGATIQTLSHWLNQGGEVLLAERTTFIFSVRDNDFIIDRIATLEAKAPEVVFKDVKDGMLGVRVARALEMPSKEPGKFVDGSGNVTTVPRLSNEEVTGMYTTADGLKGDAAWGTRSAWTALTGKKDGESISLVIIDHPKNIGYPTYWHARGYGLFAANPLGQKVFSKGREELNLTMKAGEKTVFRYRVVIRGGNGLLSAPAIGNYADEFARLYN